MAPPVELTVNGLAYGGWTRVRVTLGIEAICGTFELSISDHRNASPIREQSECSVVLHHDEKDLKGSKVITGYVDQRRLSYSATDHSLDVSGRDRAGLLVDCSAVIGKWEFKHLEVLTLAESLCKPLGIPVTLDAGAVPRPVTLQTKKNPRRVTSAGGTGKRGSSPKPFKKFSINPGDSGFDVLDRACRMAGLLPISDGVGGIVLTRPGVKRINAALVEGENILACSTEFNTAHRYARYVVTAQHPGSDQLNGKAAASVHAEASDKVITLPRTLLVRAECAMTADQCQDRANWEAATRAARGDTVSVTVQGWELGGDLIRPNRVVRILAPTAGIDGEMLITQTVFTLDNDGRKTQLTLRRPDAFLPEPVIGEDSERIWKEASKKVSGATPV